MLLARPKRIVTSWTEHLPQRRGVFEILVRVLKIDPREQTRARGKALRRVIHLGKFHPVGGESVDVRRLDLTPVTAEVGIAHVIY